jgi:hypothetical protein
LVFGVQTPVHAPLTHACPLHVTGVLHAPFDEHVSMPLFEHCFVPGVQTPVQTPPTHA